MYRYIVRRLIAYVPVLIGVSLLIFVVLRVLPGDVAMVIVGQGGEGTITENALESVRAQLGLNKPLPLQYLEWLGRFVTLDLGRSLHNGEPVTALIGRSMPATMELTLLTAVMSLLIAVPLGVVSAIRQETWLDYTLRVISIAGIAAPNFWVGLLLILGLLFVFHWFPPLGYSSFVEDPASNLQKLVWPALAMGASFAAFLSRMTRSCVLEVLSQDYIRTAWSKGLRERQVVFHHALKNALLPVVTLLGVQVALLLGGAVVMEKMFAIPGLGLALVDGIHHRDYPVVQGIIVLFSMIVLTVNLLVDLTYAWLDPRIRYL